MALQMVGPHDLRRYNPDRDMLWGLHRFFRRALEQLGDGEFKTLHKLMSANGIHVPQTTLKESMEQLIKDLAAVLANPHLKDTQDPEKEATELLSCLFTNTQPGYVALRTLFSVMFLKGVVCELPIWCAMTRPKHPNDPLPSHDEIEDAANEFLNKIGTTGGTASDD